MRRTKFRLAVIAFVLIWLVPLSFSGSAAEPREGSEEHNPKAHEAKHGGHRHHVGVFAGTTHADGENEFTVGADYEYRVPGVRFLGVGGLVDHAGGELDATVVAAAAFFHPKRRLRLLVAPGIEREHGENESLVRVGVAYRLRLKRLTISPEFNVDFVDGEEITVYGFSVGRGF